MPQDNKRKRQENWKNVAHNMRQDFRQNYEAPTFDQNTPYTTPDLASMNWPMNPHTRGGLSDKLAARKAYMDAQAYRKYVSDNPATPGVTNPTSPDQTIQNPPENMPQPPPNLQGIPESIAGAAQSIGGSVSGSVGLPDFLKNANPLDPLGTVNALSRSMPWDQSIVNPSSSGAGGPYTPPQGQAPPMAYGYQYGNTPGRRRRRGRI